LKRVSSDKRTPVAGGQAARVNVLKGCTS